MKKHIKRVLLIQPPAFANTAKTDINPNLPLGIAYIAAVLEREKYEVKILDAFVEGWDKEEPVGKEVIRVGLTFEEIECKIQDFSPDVVGVSNLFTAQRKNAHKVCKIAKKVSQDILVIMGGAHPTVAPEIVLEDKNVDFVVLGEGENTIVGLMNYLKKEVDLRSLDGVAFRENGKVVVAPKTKFIMDLDSIPFPARHLLKMDAYSRAGVTHGGFVARTPYASVVTSRGCPFQCTFCSAHKVFGRKYRCRSVDNVMEEIEMLVQDYGIKKILIEDDNFTLNARRTEQILDKLIEKKYDLIWDTPNGIAVFTLNEKIIRKIKESGCDRLNLALESGNQYVLDNIIRKPLKLKKVIPLIEFARSIGMNVNVFFVVGMPEETIEQIRYTFRFARKMKFYHPHISILTPYPGTEVYEICKEKRYLVEDFNLDNLMITRYNIETLDWTIEELDNVIKSETRILRIHYYLRRPRTFLRDIIPRFLKNPVDYFKKFWEVIKEFGGI